jgi:hypothetical protein
MPAAKGLLPALVLASAVVISTKRPEFDEQPGPHREVRGLVHA